MRMELQKQMEELKQEQEKELEVSFVRLWGLSLPIDLKIVHVWLKLSSLES